MGKKEMRMRRTVELAALTILLGLFASCQIYENAELKHEMKVRVRRVLEGSRSGGGPPTVTQQEAICRWWADKIMISDQWELGRAADAYDRWRQEGGIYDNLTAFEITSVELVEDASPKTAIVAGSVDGKPFEMKVPEAEPISWTKSPKR
jgi:hypothetical protein